MQGGITAATAVAVIKPASWADGIEALDRPQKAQVALLAETLLPFPHSNEPRHVGDPDQIKHRLTHELPIRLVDVDQDTGLASSGSIKTLIQSPHDGGLQHAQVTLDVPGIGKWCLPRRWRGASQLAVKAFGHGLSIPVSWQMSVMRAPSWISRIASKVLVARAQASTRQGTPHDAVPHGMRGSEKKGRWIGCGLIHDPPPVMRRSGPHGPRSPRPRRGALRVRRAIAATTTKYRYAVRTGAA